jgi:hydrogenase maturation protease
LRGDDGLGPAVIAALRSGTPRGLTLIESAGHDLVEWLASDEFDRIVVVDAADLGRRPGSWMRLTPERLAPAAARKLTHGLGLVESLELLAALGVRPAPITLYAVQPEAVGWGPGLSREVGRAVAAVTAAIRQELDPAPPLRSGNGSEIPATLELGGGCSSREGRCSGQTRKSVACSLATRRHN